MERNDEATKAAKEFLTKLASGHYRYDRSVNSEVNYRDEKEDRDTDAVKAFTQSALFSSLKSRL